jgi:hypothetical protein
MRNAARICLFLLFVPLGAAVSQDRLATVGGLVVEMGTGKPLPRSTVLLIGATASVGNSFPALTDGEGRFVFRDVPPGRYALTAALNGYVNAEYGRKMPDPTGRGMSAGLRGIARGGARGAAPGGSFLEIRAGQPADNLLLAMIPSAAVSGRIFNEKGEPFPFVRAAVGLRLIHLSPIPSF